MNRFAQLRWSMPAEANGPVNGPVTAIVAVLHDGAAAAALAGVARPPNSATTTAAVTANTATSASPALFFIRLLLLLPLVCPGLRRAVVRSVGYSVARDAGSPDG